jgi:YVTN family beta-propeller protein
VYRRHGYVCTGGRLAKPKPLVTPLTLPASTPLPAGSTTITVPSSDSTTGLGDLAFADSALFTAGGIWRIDPTTNAVSGPLTTAAQSGDMTTGEGSVWAVDYSYAVVRRYDAGSGQLLATIQLPAGDSPEGITDADGAIWVADHHGGTISRIDPSTNAVVANIKVGEPGAGGPQGIAAGLGSVWVGVGTGSKVVRIDPATNKIQAVIQLPSDGSFEPCGGIAVGQTAVWISSCLDGTRVARINPVNNKVASIIDVGGKVAQPVAQGDTVWFVAGGDPALPPAPASIIHLDTADKVLARYALPTGFISGGATLAFGSLWFSDSAQPRAVRIPTPG